MINITNLNNRKSTLIASAHYESLAPFFHLSVTVCLFLAERPICSLVCVYVRCVYVCEDYTASGPDLVHMLLGNPPPSLPPPVTITSSRLCVLQCTNLTGRSQKLDDLSKTH